MFEPDQIGAPAENVAWAFVPPASVPETVGFDSVPEVSVPPVAETK